MIEHRFRRLHGSCEELAESIGLTRRSFLVGGGATVASLMLPCLGAFETGVAYAQELTAAQAGDGSSAEHTAHIIVLSYSEIGLTVYDVDENGTTAPVPGVTVTITSSIEGKRGSLSAVSDEDGAVVFDVSRIGTLLDLGTFGRRYRFEGSVTINGDSGHLDGYRTITLEKIRVDSGSAFKIPCCKVADASIPYFESLSFAGWDMQYGDCEVIRSEAATSEVVCSGTLRMSGASSTEVSLWAREPGEGGKLADSPVFTTTVAIENGKGSFERSAYYLRMILPTKDLLPKDRDFEVRVSAGGSVYAFETKLTVKESDIPFETGSADVVPEVSYGATGVNHTVFTLPDSFPPVLRGSSFTCWVPTLPVDFWISPFGVFFFGIGVTGEKSADSIAAFKKESFSSETFSSSKQQWNDLSKRWSDKWDSYQKMKAGSDPGSTKTFGHKLTSNWSLSLSAQAYVTAQCNFLEDPDAMKFVGQAAAIVDAYFGATFTTQFTIGPVPLFIQFGLAVDARLSFYAGVESPKGDPLAIGFAPSKTGAAFVFTVEISLTIGVGVAGVISASLRGAGNITIYVALFEAEETALPPDAPRHVVVGAGVEAAVVLQALVFKWSGKIWSEDWPSLYDNWRSASGIEGAQRASASSVSNDFALGVSPEGAGVYGSAALLDDAGGVRMDEFGKIATIVTSAELLKTREAAARASLALRAAPAPASAVDLGGGMFALPLDVSLPDPANDALTDGGEDGYVYEDVGEDPQGVCLGAAGVAGVADSGGVRPDKEIKIVSSSFSNPHEKVVVYDDIVFLFRLMSVEYPVDGKSEGRTRLSAQIYNSSTGRWGRPKILDIPVSVEGIDRADMFDYDFDVCVQTEMSDTIYQGIYVILASSVRESGDATTFFDASCEPILTFAVFNRDLRRLASVMWRDTPGAAPAGAFAVTCPRVTPIMKDGRPFLVAVGYLRHAAADATALFSESARTTCCVAVPLKDNLVHTSGVEVDPATSSLVLSSVDVSGQDGSAGSFSVFTHSNNGLSISTVTLTVGAAAASRAEGEPAALAAQPIGFTVVRNVRNRQGMSNSQPWPGRSGYLALLGGMLFGATFDPAVENADQYIRNVGPQSVKLSSFKLSDNGNVLFYVENKEGKKEQGFDEQGNPVESPTESRYRIYASLNVDGLFSEPFPLAELDHPVDSIAGVSGRSTYTFVTSSITSMESSTADLYYVEIPVVATATVLGFVAEELFVAQGDETTFDIVLRNDGNVILTGCRATLYDADTGEKAAEAALGFEAANTCASVWNPELAEDVEDAVASEPAYSDEAIAVAGVEGFHVLADPVSAGVLLPGRKAQYRVRFKIPASWHGSKNVYAAVSDFSYRTVVSAAPDGAEALPIGFASDHASLPSASIEVHESSEAFDPGLSAPATTVLAGGSGVGAIEKPGAGSEDANGGKGGSGSGLAQTGDGVGALLAAGAVGAAAAAFAAYSARRASLEAERAAGSDHPGSRVSGDGEEHLEA